MAVPVFIIAIAISGFTYVMQDYILPYANQRQDNLRNIIKGRPVQTIQPDRRWIFGSENRLYQYNFFNSSRPSLAGLSIYQFNPEGSRIREWIFASQAVWNRENQDWDLREGWRLDFEKQVLQDFRKQQVDLPETPEYFNEEVKASSKMTYLELQRYINDLEKGGFEVDYIKTELYKKFSFPLVSLIMAVIGLPFALTMGKRGALFGIVVGVLIGIVYWGAFGVFDVLGANGFLAPALAAWGPNIVFGSGAAILLSGVRT
jgi:lipopolysaccharide export LptBFGC system permease protein LptF